MKRGWLRPLIAVSVVAAGVVAARVFGLGEAIRLDNIARLKQGIESYGALAPAVFIGGYILAVVFFVPGLPITVLGGVVFGPIRGTLYVWMAATVGASLAFLVARYALRGTVESWVRASPRLARIDGLVAEHGWRIVMLTRLVPLFPFNLQNYAYGITRIGFWAYAVTSSLCMIPGTAAFTLAGGALSEGRGAIKRTLIYLAVAGVLLVLISLLPRWIGRRSRLGADLLKSGAVTVTLLASAASAHAAGDAYAKLLAAHVCASLSCPDLRAEPYGAAALDEQTAHFLTNPTKGLEPGLDGRTARISSIFRWFTADFAAGGGVVAFIRAKAGPDVAGRIRLLTDAGLAYLDDDWSLNDTARDPS